MNHYRKLVEKYIHKNSRCELCGGVEELSIHHIVARPDGPDERWNLAILCRKCHDKIEFLEFESVAQYRFYIRFNYSTTGGQKRIEKIDIPKSLSCRRAPKSNPLISCRCGCGAEFFKYNKWNQPRDYISGHNNHVSVRKIRNPKRHDKTMVLCKCGCGETRLKYDYKGRELEFIKGHYKSRNSSGRFI